MSEEEFLKKYNLKKAENTEDYQIDNETIITELQERIDKIKEELNNLYNADQNERNYKVFVEKVDKLLGGK